MVLMVEAELKRDASPQEVAILRKRWVSEGKDDQLKALCHSLQRLTVVDASPQRAVWILDTEDSKAAQILSDHFGSIWELKTSRVISQTITEVANPG